MSDLQFVASLEAQRAELEALVIEAEADGDVVGRMNFETRLGVVKEKLAELRRQDDKIGEIALLFDGAPVYGSQTIDANFAAQALSYFQSIITTLFASSLKGELAQRGKIKGSEMAALNIRGIATGSFGFILEEKNACQSSAIKTTVREALEEATALFEELTQIEEDDFLIDVEFVVVLLNTFFALLSAL